MTKFVPTLHKEIPMNARVVIPAGYIFDKDITGRVVGIASMHVLFMYIVLLDEAAQTEYGEQSAVVVPGTQLKSINGHDWRLDNVA